MGFAMRELSVQRYAIFFNKKQAHNQIAVYSDRHGCIAGGVKPVLFINTFTAIANKITPKNLRIINIPDAPSNLSRRSMERNVIYTMIRLIRMAISMLEY
jgi:hypothetical protein